MFTKFKSWGAILFEQASLDLRNIHLSKPIYRLSIDSMFSPNPKFVQADPFLFVKDDVLYLFYEQQRYAGVGELYMSSTRNLKNWTKPKLVLKETFHLSYPFVFEDGGEVYMMPESSAKREIRLYKANVDLTQFTYVCTLLRDEIVADNRVSFVDSCIEKKDDFYYLFTSIKLDGDYELHLLSSKSVFGPYIEHPCSPIVKSKKYGRCGGSLIHINENIFRVAQNCERDYGDNLSLLQITNLNPCEYKESIYADDIIERNNSIYKEGCHHMNVVNFLGKLIISSDYKSYKFYLRGLRYDLYRWMHI